MNVVVINHRSLKSRNFHQRHRHKKTHNKTSNRNHRAFSIFLRFSFFIRLIDFSRFREPIRSWTCCRLASETRNAAKLKRRRVEYSWKDLISLLFDSALRFPWCRSDVCEKASASSSRVLSSQTLINTTNLNEHTPRAFWVLLIHRARFTRRLA